MLRSVLVLPLLLLIAAGGCNGSKSTISESVEAAATGEPFLLDLGEAAEVDGHALRFVDVVEDSRCPTGAECVWEGRAKVTLAASTPQGDEARQVLTLPYAAMTDQESGTWEVGGLAITLRDLLPYPDGESSADATRQVEISVTSAG